MADKPLKSIQFPGLTDKYTVPVVDNTLAVTGAAADAKKVGDEMTDIKGDISELDERVTDLEESGTGVSEALKSALLQLASKVAYIDDDGQDYYDDLYDALNPPPSVNSITAVYTQSGTVYTSTDLDELKTDLVVTALYTDGTTATVPSADYTLTGDLIAGTSIVTVTYARKTTTFNVSVTATLHPLENGTHIFTTNARELTITKGYKVSYSAPNATTSESVSGAYLNISKVSENDTAATAISNINKNVVLFTIPSGSVVDITLKNISYDTLNVGSNTYAVLGLRNGSSELVATDRITGSTTSDITKTFTAESDMPITCVSMYVRNPFKSLKCDVGIAVDGVRWV